MFARTSSFVLFVLFTLPLLATASAVPQSNIKAHVSDLEARQTNGQCQTGTLSCCSSVQSTQSNPLLGLLLGLLGIVLGPINAEVGLNCSPISVIGVGGNSCTAQPACCQDNNFNGLITVGCSPVSISL
ncbi:hypothetical protein VKT23_000447 [Stygiomarasmius scandens]|uniref:Hydrophobin n=1 Tax=Marasmiellus scandens TaxID=2682957 RepID=A0ABR1K4G8_9AGAR